jgi:hypothetical protein
MEPFNSLKQFKSLKPPPSSSPATRRDAGEERGGGLNGLNVLNSGS